MTMTKRCPSMQAVSIAASETPTTGMSNSSRAPKRPGSPKAAMAQHHRAGRRHDYFKLNHELHLAIVAASGNSILQSTHASLILRARRGRYAALASHARWLEAMAEHELLMNALSE